MSAQHTPGPWIVDGGNVRSVHEHESESIVDWIYEDADRHLIAAAPELLEVAIDALQWIESLDDYTTTEGSAESVIAQLIAVIKKARGEVTE